MTSLASIKRSAKASARAVRGMKPDSGSGAHLYHKGTALLCHSVAPAPVVEYDAWLTEAASADRRGKTKMTGAKLRRAVVMRRNGCTFAEVGRVLGVGTTCSKAWLDRLPKGLAA